MDFKKDYSAFNAEDFAADELFRAWVLGDDAQIQAFWRYWLLENPHKKEIVGDAQNILKAVQESQPPVSEIEVDEGVEQILAQIKKVNNPKPMRIIHKRKFFLIGLAATLTLLITSSLWFFYQKKGKAQRSIYLPVFFLFALCDQKLYCRSTHCICNFCLYAICNFEK